MNWICAVCKAIVLANKDVKRVEPESHYWLPDMEEVFCSPECSLEYHENEGR